MQILQLTEEQQGLREVAREVLGQRSRPADVRRVAADPLGFDRDLWQLTGELGWLGLEAPERHGGSGQTFLESALVLQELGRATTPGPYLSHLVAVAALSARPDHRLAAAWLPRLAGGEAIGAVVLGRLDAFGHPGPTVTATSTAAGDGLTLRGDAGLVPDVGAADVLVVVADAGGEPVVLLTEPTVAEATWRPTTDQTRRLYDVTIDAAVPADHVLARGTAAGALVRSLWRRAAVGIALDGVGGAAKALELTVAYTSARVQYGRPIATFQAVKHTCADMLVACETARIATDAAVMALVTEAPDAPYWAAVAKAQSGDSYARVAGDALQLHGGIGMTWEFDLHLWLKRAKLNQALYGAPDVHRAAVTALTNGS